MFNFKQKLAENFGGLLLGGVVPAANAGPSYSVNIDTASLGNGSAYLGLYFLGLADASNSSARVTNLLGNLQGPADLSGSVTGAAPGPLVFTSANGGGEVVQA